MVEMNLQLAILASVIAVAVVNLAQVDGLPVDAEGKEDTETMNLSTHLHSLVW